MKNLKIIIKNIVQQYLNEQYIENSKDIINDYTHYKSGDKFYPKSEWANWFLSQDRKTKEHIAYKVKTNPDFKNALISNWYDYYKETVDPNISFDEFLNTEITLFRGETFRDLKYGPANGFDSFTPQIDLAKKFSHDGKIIELKIKPKDTYGMMNTVGGEVEILVPTKFSDEFLENKFNQYMDLNSRIIDKLSNQEINMLSELINNKQYDKAFDLFVSYKEKYQNKF